MVKLRTGQVESVLRSVIDRVVNDPALKGNSFFTESSGNRITISGYVFKRYDPSGRKHSEEILQVRYTADRQSGNFVPETDLELSIIGVGSRTILAVVKSDNSTPEQYEAKLYVAIKNGLVQSLREKGYIKDESITSASQFQSELHWHAISKLADIIERLQ